jgi:outer membrane protein TolC
MQTAGPHTHTFLIIIAVPLAAGLGCYRYVPIAAPGRPDVGPVDSPALIDFRDTAGSSATSGTVTEEEVVWRALEHSRDVDARQRQVAIVAARSSGGVLDNPELRLMRRTTADPLERSEVGLRWRVPRPWTFGAERDRQRAEEALEEVELTWARNGVAEQSRTGCVELGYLTAMEESQALLVDGLNRVVDLVRREVRMGTAKDVDLRTTEFVLLEARSDLQQINHLRARARNDLQQLTGGATPVDRCDATETLPALDLERLLTIAWSHRPELEEARRRHRRAAARLYLERAEALPWLSFIGPAVRFDSRPADGTGGTVGRTWFEFQVGIDLPLFDANGRNIRAETLAMEADSAQAELLARDIRQQVTDACHGYERASTALLDIERTAADLLAGSDDLLDGAFRYGTVDFDWAFDIVRRRADAVQTLARQRLQVEGARVDLYVALGIVALDPSTVF